MPLEAPLPHVAERVARLNGLYRHHAAADVLAAALTDPLAGSSALVSSFGAESVVLLHMVAVIDRSTPVLFLETGMLFPETLEYQQDLAEKLGLTNVQLISPDRSELLTQDSEGLLHLAEPDACCALRKTRPLNRALYQFDTWITGRKRFQGGRRSDMALFEADDTGRIKVNPLAHWTPDDVLDYRINNRLPAHPLVEKGFSSIGCAPCTTPTAPGEDPRAGRWRNAPKTECGIHLPTLQGPQT